MPDLWGILSVLSKSLLYLGFLTSSGLLMNRLLFSTDVIGLEKRIRLSAIAFAGLGALMAMLNFALGGAVLLDDVSGLYDVSILGLLWETAPGDALYLRLIGAAILVLGIAIGGRVSWIGLVGAAIALLSFTKVGHVAALSTFWIQALLFIHLVAVAFWIGVLTPLRKLARDHATLPNAARLGHRFGQIASLAVPTLIIAGLIMTWFLVGSMEALLFTPYGQFLVIKVAVVGALLVLAVLNKTRFVPGLHEGNMSSGQGLARSIQLEWVCIWLILLATGIFTSVLTLPT